MKIKRKIKPIEHDINLKYLCPNPACCCPHWLSFKEASTKDFKVVCYCGQIFTVKRVKGVNIEYARSKIKTLVSTIPENTVDPDLSGAFEMNSASVPVVPPAEPVYNPTMQEQAIDHLKTYGFTEVEATKMIHKALEENPDIDSHITLVKHSLFWVNND